jgi:SAM-dependent methyltransferase
VRPTIERRKRGGRLWPLPALLAWSAGWMIFIALRWAGASPVVAIAAGVAAGAAASVVGNTPWRRVFVAVGFPLSLLASGFASGVPAWGWLLPLLLLALVYPVNAWRDAPVFPTPADALRGLSTLAPLSSQARVLDAGCGLGDALKELHREYPALALDGLEWSWPLTFICRLRCRFADVRRGDIWAADWSAYEMVYVFQRPESMRRATEKALREMRPGAWLASLEFDAPDLSPTKLLDCGDGRKLWLYQVPFRMRPG